MMIKMMPMHMMMMVRKVVRMESKRKEAVRVESMRMEAMRMEAVGKMMRVMMTMKRVMMRTAVVDLPCCFSFDYRLLRHI